MKTRQNILHEAHLAITGGECLLSEKRLYENGAFERKAEEDYQTG